MRKAIRRPMGTVLCLAVLAGAATLSAQQGAQPRMGHDEEPDHVMLTPSDMEWADGPASLPRGAKIAVIEGDPTSAGAFTMRLKVPAGYQIPPHFHPQIEHVTVISGSFYMGLGERFDKARSTKLPEGGFAVMAIGTRHFAWTDEEAVIQVHGVGPWGITYVDPATDPRAK
jgi:quercetin dioxygenase-like cupin family protein